MIPVLPLLVVILTLASAAMASAKECHLPAPRGPVVLEVEFLPVGTGTNTGTRRIALDRAALAMLPQDGFSTTTIWTDGIQEFKGVRLRKFADCLGINSGLLTLIATNDYLIEIPVDELRADGALIAYERNGAPMATRDKGPLWLVYPYDADPEFRTETVYAQSIWQLDRIEVSP